MSYISATEIAVLLPAGASIGTNTTPLTLGEVATMVAQVSAEVDGYVSAAGVAVPIDVAATGAYAQVQRIVTQGVAAQVLNTLFPNVSGQSRTTLAAEYQDAYEKALEMIAEGKLALVGAAEDTGETGRALPRSFQTSNANADAAVLSASPLVSMIWQP